MQASIRLAPLRRLSRRQTVGFSFFAAILCCGCNQEFPSISLSPPEPTRVSAVWPGQPVSAAERYGLLYGTCLDAVTDSLLIVCGEQPSWKANVVICNELTLTEAQARLLANTTTDIFLPRLETLSPAAARALSLTDGILSMPELQSLSSETAAALGGRREALVLTALPRLSAQAAAGLARCEGPLKLDGLWELEPGVATELAAHVGPLTLNGLRQICPADARALARHRGDVCLNGLKVLSDEAAEALAALEYGLHINEVEILSSRAAAALSKHQGWCLGLHGLRADWLPDQVVALLIQHPRANHCLGNLSARL